MTKKGEYPIVYRNMNMSIEKARVLLKLKLGVVFPRTMSLQEEIRGTQMLIDSHPEIDDEYYYVRDRRNKLIKVSYISGTRSIVPELIVQEGRYNDWNVYRKHSDGYLEWLKSFKTIEEAYDYIK